MARFRRGRRQVSARGAQSAALKALSLAALALPGLASHGVKAQEWDGIDVQATHYAESKHDIIGLDYNDFSNDFIDAKALPQGWRPIVADSLRVESRFRLFDRLRVFLNISQDTWSGASAIAIAPAAAGANVARHGADGLTVTGASPILGTSAGLAPVMYDRSLTNIYSALTNAIDNRMTQVMSSASPETRRQVDVRLRYEWAESALDFGGGISTERDYRSRFLNFGGQFEFNKRQTTLSWALGYTSSKTHATLDSDALPFLDTEHYVPYIDVAAAEKAPSGYVENIFDEDDPYNPTEVIMHGVRHDWTGKLGLSRVINTNTAATVEIGYTRSTGYLANPYKAVLGHTVRFLPGEQLGEELLYNGTGGAFLEVRPEKRSVYDLHIGLAHYIGQFDAALHVDYSFAHDSWGINAHTIKAEWAQPFAGGWMVTPNIRYYSQSRADFYTTGIIQTLDENYEIVSRYPKYFSSDTRLSGFGTLSGGATIAKEIVPGVSLELGVDYFTHKGSLKLGGGGEKSFADYHYWTTGLALKLKPSDFLAGRKRSDRAMAGMHHHDDLGDDATHAAHHAATPAGIMFDHALAQAGDYMIGYTFSRSRLSGDILAGSHIADLDTVRNEGCGGQVCAVTPSRMHMQMHMLHLMYAPTDWMTLMVMPQYMSMSMDMLPNPDFEPMHTGGHGGHHGVHRHETGSFGDTGLFALFSLFDAPHHKVTLALGGTAPTGKFNFKFRKTGSNPVDSTRLHYGMQIGSGSWDFMPSLTYAGDRGALTWGIQATGTLRGGKNDAGYELGNIFQASLWGGYRVNGWMTATARTIFTSQGAIRGAIAAPTDIDPLTGEIFVPEHVGPFDQTGSYGGKFWDVGIGVNLTLPEGTFAGNVLRFEWLQPVSDDVNGFQLERKGSLILNWSSPF